MFSRYAFAILGTVFLICVLIQVFLAGMAVFVNPANWGWHITFIHFFELIPLFMLLAGWLGRVGKKMMWQTVGVFGLIFVQYLTANLRPALPALAALHPVTAIPLAALAYTLMVNSWKSISSAGPAETPVKDHSLG